MDMENVVILSQGTARHTLTWWCSNCNYPHSVPVMLNTDTTANYWGFDGNLQEPTLEYHGLMSKCFLQYNGDQKCHCFIVKGHIVDAGEAVMLGLSSAKKVSLLPVSKWPFRNPEDKKC